MKPEENEYKKDSHVNREDLENEAAVQASLVEKWYRYFSIAKAEKEFLQNKMDIKEARKKRAAKDAKREYDREVARLKRHVRKHWKDEGFDSKPNNDEVESWVESHKDLEPFYDAKEEANAYVIHEDYQELKTLLIEAEKRYNILDGAQKGIVQRRGMIQVLSDLWMSGYWSSDIKIQKERNQYEDFQFPEDQSNTIRNIKRRSTNG